VATSKPFIHLFYAASANIIKDFETEVERLIIYYFIREQYKHNFNINFYLKMKLNKQNED